MDLTVLSWNIFHARDGRGAGALHLNRKLESPIARAITRCAPDIAALQEVPTAAVRALVRHTGMSAVWGATGPLIGPRALRDRLARANPDLWRSREGNANVLLIGPRLRVTPGGGLRRTLNDLGTMAATVRRARPPVREVANWVAERRGIVVATVTAADAPPLRVGCVHLHNSYLPGLAVAEARRVVAAMDDGADDHVGLLIGDLNVRPGHPALNTLIAGGWDDAGTDRGIDRILHRGVTIVAPPQPLPDSARTVLAPHRGRWRPVLLSDHAPVIARIRLTSGDAGDDRDRG
jgi:endonuclease/exonuclease/phosphatase family metal-dependent hydrolase